MRLSGERRSPLIWAELREGSEKRMRLDANIEAMQKPIRRETKEKTGTAEKFFNSETERQKLRDEARLANRKLLSACQMRFKLVLDFALGKFDTWIEEVCKRSHKVWAGM